MSAIVNVRTMLSIPDGQDDILEYIVDSTQQRLKLKLGTAEIPDELEHVVVEVSIARFNRIGSEGINAHTIEGESYSFADDDFAPYEEDIRLWQATKGSKGKVRFI